MRWLPLCAGLFALAGAEPQARAPLDPERAGETKAQDPKAPPPAEYNLSVREGAWRVNVSLRPGQAEAGQLLEVLLDVARHPDIPDPTYGDRIPLQGAILQLSMSGPGARERRRLWALGDAGIYGTHWTPTAKGLWTVTLEAVDGQGELPRLSFQVGVGVPMPASSEGQAVRSARVVMAGAQPVVPGRQALRELMQELTRHWMALGRAGSDEKAELAAVQKAVAALPGTVPQQQAAESAEYDGLAQKLAAQLATPELRAEAEKTSCLQCHAKYRDRVVSDLAPWPEVKPWKK